MSERPAKRRRDWAAILAHLADAGVPAVRVARECGRQPTTVQAWAAGGDPKESDARVVLALLAKHAPAAYAAQELVYGIAREMEHIGLSAVQSRRHHGP